MVKASILNEKQGLSNFGISFALFLKSMQFSNPGLLWALGLLAIPIIIHLFYFRRYKQVYFTNVRFLKELVEETSHRNKLKNLLILACRLLAFASIILAFAQPFLKDGKAMSNRHRAISIFIDNSWSMNANSADGSLFNKAKKSAIDIVKAFSDYDKFQIVSHELSGRQTRIFSKQEALSAIEEIKQGSAVNVISKIIRRQNQSLQGLEGFDKEVYLISDLQKSIMDSPADVLDSSIQMNVLPLYGVSENNIAIDTAYFVNPVILKSQTNYLVYQLHNYGSSAIENMKLSYNINGQEYPVSGINIAAKKTYIDTIALKINSSGTQKLILKIADYPIQFDDQYFMSFNAEEEVNILLIYNKIPPQNLIQAFNSIPYFKTTIQESGALSYNDFGNYKLIVLADLSTISSGFASELAKVLNSGSNVFIFPAEGLKDQYINLETQIKFPKLKEFSILKKEVGSIQYESGLFDDVFARKSINIKLPFVMSSYQLNNISYSEPILSYRDGSPYILRYPFSNAFVYVCSSSANPDINSLSKNAEIFLPLLFKASISGKNLNTYSYILGKDQLITWPIKKEIALKENALRFKGPEEFITSARLYPNQMTIDLFDQMKTSGIYDIYNQENIIGSIAFNENRLESNLEFLDKKDLEKLFGKNLNIIDSNQVGNLTASIQDSKDKQSLWWYLILGGILFLLLESLLIRFWKNK